MAQVGNAVIYTPHAGYDHLTDYAGQGLAATIGRMHADGTADLFVLVPNKEAHWQDAVPEGTGPHTWRHA